MRGRAGIDGVNGEGYCLRLCNCEVEICVVVVMVGCEVFDVGMGKAKMFRAVDWGRGGACIR
jgi:hypothetical protein